MKKQWFTWGFLIVQIILYISFLNLDLTGESISTASRIKFSVILLCFCYVLLTRGSDRKSQNLLRAALLFTVISDLIILFFDYEFYFIGVLSFVIVQQLHGIRISHLDERMKVTSGYVLLVLQFVITLLFYLILEINGVEIDKLIIITVFYFISLLTNVFRSVRLAVRQPKRNTILYAVGFVLFLFCDINVGLFNLSDFIALSGNVVQQMYSLSAILMWTFYAPSQVLIALSQSNRIFIVSKIGISRH